MSINHNLPLAVCAMIGAVLPVAANAQPVSDLMGMSVSQLRDEMDRRYDDALALTIDQAVVGANDDRYMWASQAKAQCGIAVGFLKSGTKDPVSVGKCVDAHNRMQAVAPVVQYAAPPPPPPVVCNRGPVIVFFDWDKSDILPEAATTLDSLATTYAGCGNAAVSIAGYADRSGSNQYNVGLSERRAAEVKQYLASHGMAGAAMSTRGFGEENPRVPTADGVRELQNRRVEISVN